MIKSKPLNLKLSILIKKKHIFLFLISIVIFAVFLRLMIAFNDYHYLDLDYYEIWSDDLYKYGLFNAYTSVRSLDYPPLFLFPLYLVGWLRSFPVVLNNDVLTMITFKMFQLTFDILTIILIYIALKKYNRIMAIGMACTWAVNPAIIINSSSWGQTDSIMLFLLLCTFYLLDNKKPVFALIVFALSCLIKYQSLYFAIVVILFLFKRYNLKKSLLSLLASITTGVLVFIPFMINHPSGIFLPLKVYFGGLNTWENASMNAFNFNSMIGLNFVNDTQTNILGIPIYILGYIFLFLSAILVIFLFLRAPNKCPYILSFVLIQSIFMFTSRMHERYQIPTIIFLLMACIIHKSSRLFILYILISIISFINQYIVISKVLNNFQKEWNSVYVPILMTTFSVVNLIIYLISIKISVDILYNRKAISKVNLSTENIEINKILKT